MGTKPNLRSNQSPLLSLSYQSNHNYFLPFLSEAKCLLNAKQKYPIKI